MQNSETYLDTSAVLRLGKILESSAADQFTTSALTIVELISGSHSSPKQFRISRQALRRLTQGPVEVEWELPDAYMAKAFDWIIENYVLEERRMEALQRAAKCIIDSPDSASAEQMQAADLSPFTMRYWCEYDNEFGMAYTDAASAGHRVVKAAFDAAKRDGSSDLPASALVNFRAFCDWFAIEKRDVNFSATLAGLAAREASAISMMTGCASFDESQVAMIYESYNGSIDVFLDAFSFCSITDHRDRRQPARNDALDLAHLLYVQPGDLFVTADDRLGRVARIARAEVTSPEKAIERQT
jgi:hypothetical protein